MPVNFQFSFQYYPFQSRQLEIDVKYISMNFRVKQLFFFSDIVTSIRNNWPLRKLMGRTLVIEILIIKVIPRPGYNTSWNFRRNFYSGGSIEFLRNFLETCTRPAGWYNNLNFKQLLTIDENVARRKLNFPSRFHFVLSKNFSQQSASPRLAAQLLCGSFINRASASISSKTGFPSLVTARRGCTSKRKRKKERERKRKARAHLFIAVHVLERWCALDIVDHGRKQSPREKFLRNGVKSR